jgi:hypothetical protein
VAGPTALKRAQKGADAILEDYSLTAPIINPVDSPQVEVEGGTPVKIKSLAVGEASQGIVQIFSAKLSRLLRSRKKTFRMKTLNCRAIIWSRPCPAKMGKAEAKIRLFTLAR